MPAAVMTRTRKQVRPDVEIEEEVETKADADVIVDKGLARLLNEWETQDNKAESYFVKVCQYVAENDITRPMLKKGLIELRGMKDLTANNEVSKIFKAIDHPDLIEKAAEGEMTVRELREAISTGREPKDSADDASDKLHKRLRLAARFAITNDDLQYDDKAFLRDAGKAYREVYKKIEAEEPEEEEEEAA
jgi:hypothetical protein